ncbi:hypothetical protein [Spirosoma foliorum]|uniref:Uncharacterized protein n=1 Tax=Spirosoma foliorum TaxID=2710596 RepID=A0A7G5GTU3_9BACT|nr:hypothetical protein [Spirosoma foliorum]QMW02285.1 hypothetical protein H3H32_30910 [Spirosoma foliorum]
MCNPEPAANSPMAELMLSESRLRTMTTDEKTELVSEEFTRFRQLLWEYIELADDPNSYVTAWNTIDVFGKVALAEYQATGNQEALDRVKNTVKASLELV